MYAFSQLHKVLWGEEGFLELLSCEGLWSHPLQCRKRLANVGFKLTTLMLCQIRHLKRKTRLKVRKFIRTPKSGTVSLFWEKERKCKARATHFCLVISVDFD
ncbi:Hypothetical predicted protein [Podarcis lilfordi]|uniref:Uncharacterized protein n=1 Tax=Podarcis lilfordi TaxID=74358 RepID=A0AA35K158_9SAUR|nr:Hypothetical predicted protein [Podarcis lilfordi]